MKYHAIIMVPQLVEIVNPGSPKNVTNEAYTHVSQFQKVFIGEDEYAPKLLCIHPVGKQPDQPLVFDPPPMAA